jgi:hypothetical protein
MNTQKRSAQAHTARPRRSEPFKDEVYRQMFRLESSRPGAAIDLAVALLRAWMAADSASASALSDSPSGSDIQQWLRKISPICLAMIESSLRPDATPGPCPH